MRRPTSRPRRWHRFAAGVVLALVAALAPALGTPAQADHDLPPAVNGPIAFVANHDIWYRDETGQYHQVTHGLTRPAWDLELSPDGRRIAFSHSTGAGLWVVNLNGTGMRNVLAGYKELGGQGGYDPSWDPSGHRLVFTAYSSKTGNHELYTVNADQPGTLKRLTRWGVGSEAVPVWNPTPGSNEVAFIQCCSGRIKTIDVKTLEERFVSAVGAHPAWNIDWSPDGTKLAVEAYTDGRLYTVDRDGTNWVYLDPDYMWSLTYPSWSPDGTTIAVQGLDPHTKELGILTVNATTGVRGGITSLTHEFGNVELAPTWGPVCQEQCIGTELTGKVLKKRGLLKVRGLLRPGVTGQRVEVTLLRKTKRGWRNVATRTPTTNAKGGYAASFERPKARTCGVFVEFQGSDDHMSSYKAIPPFRC